MPSNIERVRVMVFNATSNNISAISWRKIFGNFICFNNRIKYNVLNCFELYMGL